MKTEYLNSHCMVELRNGERRILAKVGNGGTKILVDPSWGRWNYLSHWDDDGKVRPTSIPGPFESSLNTPAGDIMRIYSRITGTQNYGSALNATTDGRKLLWERHEAKKMTVKEIEKILGYEVEIVGEAE